MEANPHAKRLYDDLLSNYNRLIRPVSNNTEKVLVKLGLKLSQLIDVDLKNQIMTTNVWVEQVINQSIKSVEQSNPLNAFKSIILTKQQNELFICRQSINQLLSN